MFFRIESKWCRIATDRFARIFPYSSLAELDDNEANKILIQDAVRV
jgi:hypothetical protein